MSRASVLLVVGLLAAGVLLWPGPAALLPWVVSRREPAGPRAWARRIAGRLDPARAGRPDHPPPGGLDAASAGWSHSPSAGTSAGVWSPIRSVARRPRSWRRGPSPPRPGPAEVAATLDLAGLAVLAGSGLVEALELVAGHATPPVAGQLRAVCAAARWGWSWDRAWRVAGPAWDRGRRAFVLAEVAGASPAQPLRAAAADLRREHAQRAEEQAARLGVRIVLPLGLAHLPAFVLLAVVPLVLALASDLWS